ncbi:MAG: L-serine ammonia-lyase [Oscillospiraceae bacterium]|nr:L-serine ammonia-lyase [Oscillospiraceae bacterium]
MCSLRELYKIGRGPSSSHTIGPERACIYFKEKYPDAEKFKVILYGSLAYTGEGHDTKVIIADTLAPTEAEIVCDFEEKSLLHPNTMKLFAYKSGEEIGADTIYSVGGGQIKIEGQELSENKDIYNFHSFSEILDYCKKNNLRIWQYVEEIEGKEIWEHLSLTWQTMQQSILAGLSCDGVLPGRLKVQRKAKFLFEQNHIDETRETRENRLVCAYAFAVSEQNAACERIVTAPTCGASGVLPAVLYYQKQKHDFTDKEILRALATAGVVGNIVKTNASISGAECGCQAEIGTACSMAAAALGELFSMSLEQIEYAAEIALEHHLGLTCDPIYGLVQIPCIERNAVAAMRAINAVSLANFLTSTRKISFDLVVKTMYETGKDLSRRYRETSEGGLAKLYK